MNAKTNNYLASLLLPDAIRPLCKQAMRDTHERFSDKEKSTTPFLYAMYDAVLGITVHRKYVRYLLDIADSPTPRLVMLNQMRDEGLFTKDLTPEDITWLEEPQV